jgi:hypothetical protein
MSRYVPIRFNDEEAAWLERSFGASGDDAVSTHIKRIYFDATRPQGDVLQGIRSDLERIGAGIERLRQRQGEAMGQSPADESDLMLGILCGLYVMVRKSVGDSIRAQADQALDIAAIEAYLKGR